MRKVFVERDREDLTSEEFSRAILVQKALAYELIEDLAMQFHPAKLSSRRVATQAQMI